MQSQYDDSQRAAEQAFIKQWGFQPNPSQLLVFMQGDAAEMQSLILRGLAAVNAAPEFLYAVKKLGFLITPQNKDMYTDAEKQAWVAAIANAAEVSTVTPNTKTKEKDNAS